MTVRFVLKSNLPKELFHIEAAKFAQDEAFDMLAKEAKELFKKTVSTWKRKPTFAIYRNKDGRSIGTRGEYSDIYGVGEFLIPGPKALAFALFIQYYTLRARP